MAQFTVVQHRVIVMAVTSEPLAREHANHMVVLKGGAAASRQVFALLATGVWKWTVIAIFNTMLDLAALQRMTFNCDLAPLRLEDIDDWEAVRFVRHGRSRVSHRAS